MKKLLVLAFLSLTSSILFAQWSYLGNSSVQGRCLASDGYNLFLGTDYGGILRSSNNGLTWDTVNNGLTQRVIRDIEIRDSILFAGTWNGLFISSDGGQLWKQMNNGISNLDITSIVAKDSLILAGTNGGGIFKSLDTGRNWTAINNNLESSQLNVLSLVADSTTIYAGTYVGIVKSTDNGKSWKSVNGVKIQTTSIDIYDSIMIAGTIDGVYKSENRGETWFKSSYGITEDYVTAVLIEDKIMFAGTWGESIFNSIDNASSWIPNNTNFTGNYISDFTIHNNKLIASTLYEGVWELSNILVFLPEETSIEFNSLFPNPVADLLRFKQTPDRVSIFNYIGELKKSYLGQKDINISEFDPGVYIILIEENNRVYKRKFFKE